MPVPIGQNVFAHQKATAQAVPIGTTTTTAVATVGFTILAQQFRDSWHGCDTHETIPPVAYRKPSSRKEAFL